MMLASMAEREQFRGVRRKVTEKIRAHQMMSPKFLFLINAQKGG
jgi:hypothetical protein